MVDKPFKTFDEQISILIDSHELLIQDKESAKEILKLISYYDLVNGYKDHFMINEKYQNALTIEDLFLYSIFDKSFQNILFKYSIYVENKFRNAVAYVISENIGVEVSDYLNPENYRKVKSTKKRQKKYKLFSKIKKIYSTSPIPEPTNHYATYKNHIPPWILFKNVSFSSLIDLYFFLEDDLKDKVVELIFSKRYLVTDKRRTLIDLITIVRIFRNAIAHNLKFVTYDSSNIAYINTQDLKHDFLSTLINSEEIFKGVGRSDRFSMLVSLMVLINDKVIQFQLYLDITTLFNQFRISEHEESIMQLYLTNVGLPTNIDKRIMNFIHY